MELGLIPKKRKDNDIEKIYAKDKVEPHNNIKKWKWYYKEKSRLHWNQ